jgi:hypothetical protein
MGPQLGAGREAEVYAWGDDAVVKLYRPGYCLDHRLRRRAGSTVKPMETSIGTAILRPPVNLLAGVQGAALLANAFRDPDIMTGQVRHLEPNAGSKALLCPLYGRTPPLLMAETAAHHHGMGAGTAQGPFAANRLAFSGAPRLGSPAADRGNAR